MGHILAEHNVFASCISIICFYLVCLVLYRLTLHPLAKYPGPLLSKISGFSILYQSTTQDRHLLHLKEHERYGSIVRVGPNTLSFSSPNALQQIYQSKRQQNQLRKADWYKIIDAPTGAFSIHTEISRRKHAVRRKVLDHAFSSTALQSYESHIIDANKTLEAVLAPDNAKGWSHPRNMKHYANWFTYDVMGALVFGRRFDCMTNPMHRSVPKIMMASSAFTYIAGYLPCQFLIRPIISSPVLMQIFGGQIGRDEHAYVQYANSCMSVRLTKDKNLLTEVDNKNCTYVARDIMHYIITAGKNLKETCKAWDRAELDADASLLIAAGSDTTALTLAALLFYLTLPTSNRILRKLQEAVRDLCQFPTVDSITANRATRIAYLRACIDEALRLAPAVPSLIPRTVVQLPGIEIDGHFIPSATTVGASAYVLHHDEKPFPDPWKFDPDRWIVEEGLTQEMRELRASQVKDARDSFIPFSLGSRGCVGRDLAYQELSICIARLVYVFEFRRANGGMDSQHSYMSEGKPKLRTRSGIEVFDDEYQLYDCFLADRNGPQVEFKTSDWRANYDQPTTDRIL